jgi:hypothetical protein
MFGRRAFRPAGSPSQIDDEVRRALPTVREGGAAVYTGQGPFRYIGSFDTWRDADTLADLQRSGYIVWS